MFVNYGVSKDADDDLVAESNVECATLCMNKYYSCDYYFYNSQSRDCKLLRLYEEDYSDAYQKDEIVKFYNQGYMAFKLNF